MRLAIIGDFDQNKVSHVATDAAIRHSTLVVDAEWIPTTKVGDLSGFDGIWGAPGSPFEDPDGMLRAIRYARENDVPYLGTCAGFQYALIEFTRSVLGVADADTAENDPFGKNIVITPLDCPLNGSGVIEVVPGTLLEGLCGAEAISGQYFCSFETNALFLERWTSAGLRVSGRGPDGEMRALDLPANRFFLATLFQPQRSSTPDEPHPIVEGFLRACANLVA